MPALRKYNDEMRDRAVLLVQDLLSDEELQLSVTAACTRVGEQLGINRDTLRGWVKQVQIDEGARVGTTSSDRARLARLEKENRELRRASAILKPLRLSSRWSSTAHSNDREVHRGVPPHHGASRGRRRGGVRGRADL
jgi:transposase